MDLYINNVNSHFRIYKYNFYIDKHCLIAWKLNSKTINYVIKYTKLMKK